MERGGECNGTSLNFLNRFVCMIQRKSHNYGWITLARLILSESKVWGGYNVDEKRKWLRMMATGCVLGSLLITAACSGKKTSTEDEKTIKVGVLASLTGPLESYGKQTMNGFELGLDYATGGTGKVEGKKIKFVVEDTETKADVAVKKLRNY